MKRCPVCKTELTEQISQCPTCGFKELNKNFISPEDAQAWFERVVVPFREEWENTPINSEDFEIDGTTLVRYKGKSNTVKIPRCVISILRLQELHLREDKKQLKTSLRKAN